MKKLFKGIIAILVILVSIFLMNYGYEALSNPNLDIQHVYSGREVNSYNYFLGITSIIGSIILLCWGFKNFKS